MDWLYERGFWLYEGWVGCDVVRAVRSVLGGLKGRQYRVDGVLGWRVVGDGLDGGLVVRIELVVGRWVDLLWLEENGLPLSRVGRLRQGI